MAFIGEMSCCAAGEIRGLDRYRKPSSLIKEASRQNMAWLVAFFLKPKKQKKWKGQKLKTALRKYGFKPGKIFINPNTGNTLQAYTYLIPKKDRAKPDNHNPMDPWMADDGGW